MARWGMEVRVVDKRWLEKTIVTEMTKCYTCWYNLWRGQLHGQVPLMAACECTQRLRTQYRSARLPPCLSNQRSGVAKRRECFTTFFSSFLITTESMVLRVWLENQATPPAPAPTTVVCVPINTGGFQEILYHRDLSVLLCIMCLFLTPTWRCWRCFFCGSRSCGWISLVWMASI